MQYSQLEHHESIRKLSSVNKGLFSKVVQIYVYKIGENSDLFLFPTKARFPTLKPAAFEDVYLHPVASKASGGRILNTNQLHNKEQVVNTNQQTF